MRVGDYGANNPWEYIAVCASAFESDGSEDEVISRRETLRNNDPAMFYLLSEIWPGDCIVDLQPLRASKPTPPAKSNRGKPGRGGILGEVRAEQVPVDDGDVQACGITKLATV